MFIDDLSVSDIEQIFPSAAGQNVRRNWPEVKKQLKAAGLSDRAMVLYALGTIVAENQAFSPSPERPSKYTRTVDRAGYQGINDPGEVRPFGAYDSTIRTTRGKVVVNKSLGNAYYPGKDENLMRSRHGMPLREDLNDGEKYRGRGYIQLTGKYNYQRMQAAIGKKLGIDLVSAPDTASDPIVAARILATFLASRRDQITHAMSHRNFEAARKAVNTGGLHWQKLRDVVEHYEALEGAKPKTKGGADTDGSVPTTSLHLP